VWSESGTGVDELSFDFPIFKPIERAPGYQKQVIPRGNVLLLVSKNLPQPPFGACALHSWADGCGRRHDTDPAKRRRNHVIFRRRGAEFVMVTTPIPKCKTATLDSAALFTNGPNIALAPQVLLGAETHDRTRN